MLSLDVGVVDWSEGDKVEEAVGSVGGGDEGGAGAEVAADGVATGAEETVGTVGGADGAVAVAEVSVEAVGGVDDGGTWGEVPAGGVAVVVEGASQAGPAAAV